MNVDGGSVKRKGKKSTPKKFMDRVKNAWFNLPAWKQTLLALSVFPIMLPVMLVFVLLIIPRDIIDRTLEDM